MKYRLSSQRRDRCYKRGDILFENSGRLCMYDRPRNTKTFYGTILTGPDAGMYGWHTLKHVTLYKGSVEFQND